MRYVSVNGLMMIRQLSADIVDRCDQILDAESDGNLDAPQERGSLVYILNRKKVLAKRCDRICISLDLLTED